MRKISVGVLTRRLVAYDGSPSAHRALLQAAELHRQGDEIGVIHVADRLPDVGRRLDDARSTLSTRGMHATPHAIEGNAAHAICVEAARRGHDTIVVGRRNVSDAGLVLLGSVAARVVAGPHGRVVVVA